MKIKFAHFTLAYPDPRMVTVEFAAETEFEAAYLKTLLDHTKGFHFQFVHPGSDPKILNAMQLALKAVPDDE